MNDDRKQRQVSKLMAAIRGRDRDPTDGQPVTTEAELLQQPGFASADPPCEHDVRIAPVCCCIKCGRTAEQIFLERRMK